jgi:hypothetical protein
MDTSLVVEQLNFIVECGSDAYGVHGVCVCVCVCVYVHRQLRLRYLMEGLQ